MRNIIRENLNKLILEASKKDILINKVGFSEEIAQRLEELCGPLSVWMAKKIIEYQIYLLQNSGKTVDVKTAVDRINNSSAIKTWNSVIVSIMDWIRVGLDGNVKDYKDLTFQELYKKSEDWHDSLELGGGEINYVEKHPIILDFRDESGNGFYWADLETKNSPEECDRMGHCGRSSYGYLYSLRENKKLPGGKYTVNTSHLTAAIDADGTLFQLKGPKNSKPQDKYHKLILPLFSLKNENDDFFIENFGTEYASEQDFKLSDLPNDVIVKIYEERPELFSTRGLQRKLMDLGIIEKPNINYNIKIEIDPSNVDSYVDGDYLVSRRRKDKEGKWVGRDIGLFETILSDDIWDLWQSGDGDWESALQYECDSKNESKIEELIKLIATKENEDLDVEEFNEMSLDEKIQEYDSNWEIRSALGGSYSDAQADDYYNHLRGTLKECLNEYGKVEKMDDTGVIIHVDMSKYLEDLNDEWYDDYMDRCDDDLICVFGEMIGNEIDRPKFSIDDRWYPDVNTRYFNEILEDRLSDIDIK
jgi:hypothetical protein